MSATQLRQITAPRQVTVAARRQPLPPQAPAAPTITTQAHHQAPQFSMGPTDMTTWLKQVLKDPETQDLMCAALGVKDAIESNTSRIDELEQAMAGMKIEMEQMKQYSRRNAIRIMNCHWNEESQEENTDQMVLNLIQNLGITNFTQKDISRSHRIGHRDRGLRPVLVKFTGYRAKELVMKKKSSLPDGVYRYEELSPYMFNLAYEARQMKREHRVADTWVYDGRVYIKPTARDRPVVVHSINDLFELLPQEGTYVTFSDATNRHGRAFGAQNTNPMIPFERPNQMPATRLHHTHGHANATITLTPNANEVSNNMGPAQTTPAENTINTSGVPPITNTSGAPPITSTSGAPLITNTSGAPPITSTSGVPPITNTSGVPPITQNTEPLSSETVPLTTTDGSRPDVTEPRDDTTTKEAPQSRAEPLTGPDASITAHQPSIELDNLLKEMPISGIDNTTQNVALTPGHLRFTPRPSKPSKSYKRAFPRGPSSNSSSRNLKSHPKTMNKRTRLKMKTLESHYGMLKYPTVAGVIVPVIFAIVSDILIPIY